MIPIDWTSESNILVCTCYEYFVKWLCGVVFFFEYYESDCRRFEKEPRTFFLLPRKSDEWENVKETVPVLQAISRFQLLHSILQVTGIPKTFIKTKLEFLAFRPKFLSTHLNWIFCTNGFINIFNLDFGKMKHLRFLLVSRIRER